MSENFRGEFFGLTLYISQKDDQLSATEARGRFERKTATGVA